MTSSARSWAGFLRPCITLDLRGLALLRVGLALSLLLDASLRLCDAGLLYADSGLYPRALAVTLGDPARWSLHLLNGTAAYALLLTVLQQLAALALLLGWHTRTATVIAWALAVSASARNPLVAVQSDLLLQALLLWGAFLPWQARWSIDRAGAAASDDPAHASWASLALMTQVFLILLGIAAADEAGTATRVLAGLAALLLVLPTVHARRAAVFLILVICSLGFVLGAPGLLCWLGLLLGLALIDGEFWKRFVRRLDRGESEGELRLYHRVDAAGAARVLSLLREFLILPRAQVLPSTASPRVERLLASGESGWLLIDRDETAHRGDEALRVLVGRSLLLRPLRRLLAARPQTAERWLERWMNRAARPFPRAAVGPADGAAAQKIVALLAALVLLWNLGQLGGLPLLPSGPMKLLGLDQHWTAAAGGSDGWLLIAAELADGHELDALSGSEAEPDYARPSTLIFQGERDRAYAAALSAPGAQPHLQALGGRFCRILNRDLADADPRRALRLRIVQVLPPAQSASDQTEQRVLWRQDCV